MYSIEASNFIPLTSFVIMTLIVASMVSAHAVNKRKRAIAAEGKRYEDEKTAASAANGLGLWQFTRPGSTTTSTTTSTSDFTLGSINVAWDKTQAFKSKDQRLAERRKVRIIEPHTVFCADPEQDEYHEWVPIWGEDIYADTLCRDNGPGTHVWRLWVCNNNDCGAQAYVAEEKVEEVIRGWLDKAAAKPGTLPEQAPSYIYSDTSSVWPLLQYPAATFPATTTFTGNVTITGS